MVDESLEYYKQGNLDEALRPLEQILAASEESLEPDHLLVIRVLVLRAERKAAKDDSDAAITMLEKALPALEARKASENYSSAMFTIYYTLGSIHTARYNYPKARESFEKCLKKFNCLNFRYNRTPN